MRDDLFMDNMRFKKNALFQRIQNGKANFINVVLLNNDGEECIEFDYGEHVILRMVIQVNEDIDQLGYGYFIRDNNGNNLVSSTSMIENSSIQNSKVGDKYIMDWQFEIKHSF
jgi:lipopolysaccharide transport system ATP-binding protein